MDDVVLLHTGIPPSYRGTLVRFAESIECTGVTIENARQNLRQKAAAMGGNLVLGVGFSFTQSSEHHHTTFSYLIYGTLFYANPLPLRMERL